MKLYEHPFSPNCRKVGAVAYELELPIERVFVDLLNGAGQAPAFASLNPNGLVPVLDDGGFVLWESNAILRYLAEGTRLLPSDARDRADVDRWLAWQLAHLGPAIRKVAFERIMKRIRGLGTPDQAAIDAGVAEFAKFTAVLDAGLKSREHLAGSLSIADFALAAHYSLASICGLDLTPYPRAAAWLERMLSRASMKRALADAERSMRAAA